MNIRGGNTQLQMDTTILVLTLVLTLGIFVLIYIASGIKVLREYERVAVMRLGKFYGIKGPGIIWVMPILEKIVIKVSLREQQTIIDTGKFYSRDGSSSIWRGAINWRIIDVEKAVSSPENYQSSVDSTIKANVQEIGESLSSDAINIDKDLVYSRIKEVLEPILSKQGISITEVNLKTSSEWE